MYRGAFSGSGTAAAGQNLRGSLTTIMEKIQMNERKRLGYHLVASWLRDRLFTQISVGTRGQMDVFVALPTLTMLLYRNQPVSINSLLSSSMQELIMRRTRMRLAMPFEIEMSKIVSAKETSLLMGRPAWSSHPSLQSTE